MAVPGHDERDFAFATRTGFRSCECSRAPDEDGVARRSRRRRRRPTALHLVNSGRFSEMAAADGLRRDHRWLEREGKQARAWCSTGCTTGASRASGTGARRSRSSTAMTAARCRCRRRTSRCSCPGSRTSAPTTPAISPLARHQEWYEVPCPACGKPAHRETDVSDTFLDSAWYYLRYLSTEFDDRAFDPARVKRWLPVATLHRRQRARRAAPALRRFVCHGASTTRVCSTSTSRSGSSAPTALIVKDGAKMSKSRGNVVIPDQYIARVGRRQLPDVPDVPGAVRGGGRLPRRRARRDRAASSTRSGTWWISASARP